MDPGMSEEELQGHYLRNRVGEERGEMRLKGNFGTSPSSILQATLKILAFTW